MHELAIAQNIIAIVDAEAKKQNFKKVVSIKLRVGELSGIVPECLFDFFPIAARETVAEGARLTTEVIPAKVRCLSCGYEGRAEMGCCPSCGGPDIKLIAGREFFVDSIEVE
ncbi:MAG: hydrogenase maturation nickel metallochaperone HypA [Clostridia bacterium]|nr:hydrogenase maturation nickel metallochaperone HypA [Clostridia bacterium]